MSLEIQIFSSNCPRAGCWERSRLSGSPICFPGKCANLFITKKILYIEQHIDSKSCVRASKRRSSQKKVIKDGKARKTIEIDKNPSNEDILLPSSITDPPDQSSFGGDVVCDKATELNADNLGGKSSIPSPSRSTILWACTVTSGFILSLGLIVRQVSHVVFIQGWPILDSSAEVSLDFQIWHLQLIIGSVVSISSLRYFLLKIWPDFAESSEAANQQVLGSLQPLDYLVVSFLPGISEEFLFRGALLPLFGLNWMSALAIGAIFGSLHLGAGRRSSFAIWASFVGFVYGLATIASSSIIVAMASHSLNNLIGGILWRYDLQMHEKKP